MTNEEILTKIVQSIPLFANLNPKDNKEIIENIILKFYPKDTIIFNEGDEGDALYIIKQGVIRIYKLGKNITELKDNDFFGEMALISDKPRVATAKTLTNTEIFVLKKTDFMKLISNDPNMAGKISYEFIHREKENNRNFDV